LIPPIIIEMIAPIIDLTAKIWFFDLGIWTLYFEKEKLMCKRKGN